jgi:tetratricopeptide (TPR) repeat protein
METEQEELLEHQYADCTNTNTSSNGLFVLFETIETAENHLREGIHKQRTNQWADAEIAYSKALSNPMQCLMTHTQLLDDMVVTVLENRSFVRLQLKDWKGVLLDVHACLQLTTKQQQQQSPNRRLVALVARRADALQKLGRIPEAEAALEQALVLRPRDKILVHQRNRLQLAKSSQSIPCQPSSNPNRNRRRRRPKSEWNAVAVESWLARGADNHYAYLRDQQQCITVAVAKQPPLPLPLPFPATPGTSVTSRYGVGIVQEVRKCGTTKIQLESWSPGAQQPTAYLMPEYYTVVCVSE